VNCLFFTDIDECVAQTHDCSPNADCANADGTFQCTCNGGFAGEGKTCNGRFYCLLTFNKTLVYCLVGLEIKNLDAFKYIYIYIYIYIYRYIFLLTPTFDTMGRFSLGLLSAIEAHLIRICSVHSEVKINIS